MTDIKAPAAVIGLGSMGGGAALSLARAGMETRAFDIRPDAVEAIAAQGASGCDTVAQAVSGAGTVFLFVVNADQADDVLFGDKGAVAAAARGTLFVLCMTQPPRRAVAFAQALDEAGMLCLDAPVSGGSAKALSGEMTIMASGTEAALARAEPYLSAIASKVFRLGDRAGPASQMKMINQLLAGVHIAAAAEALTLAAAQGLDLDTVLEVIGECAGTSWMFQNRGPHIAAGDYTPHSAVDIFVKDLGIVTQEAQASRASVPMSDAALDLFRAASQAGHGHEDDAAVAKILAGRAGIRLPGMREAGE